jgi:drug/metabolite transporter (DMT)-like permease
MTAGRKPQVDAAAGRRAVVAGIAWMMLSTVLFVAMHTMVRLLAADIHPFEIAFFRNFLGLFLLAAMFQGTGWGALKTAQLGMHLVRGAVNSLAMIAFFLSLSLAPFASVAALGFTAPLFAAIGAALFLGERMRVRRWAATLAGFCGVLVIVRPGLAAIGFGEVLVLASAALWSVALLLIKAMSRTDSPLTITAYMNLLLTPATLAFAAFVWTWPTPAQFLWLAALACAGTLAQTALNHALRRGEIAVVMPFEFVRLIWASAIGVYLFAEPLDVWVGVGAAIIVASTSYIAYREARAKGQVEAKATAAD